MAGESGNPWMKIIGLLEACATIRRQRISEYMSAITVLIYTDEVLNKHVYMHDPGNCIAHRQQQWADAKEAQQIPKHVIYYLKPPKVEGADGKKDDTGDFLSL